jgi:hypothetical protein
VSGSGRLAAVGLLVGALLAGAPLVGCSLEPPPEVRVANEYCLHFDGDDDYLDLGKIAADHPLMLAGSTFTISAWFKQEAGGDPYQRIIDKSNAALGHNGWALGADPEAGMIHLYVHDGTGGADFASRRGLYGTGRWHHVVAVAREDRYEIWIDGGRDERTWFESGRFTLPGAVPTAARIGTWNHGPEREWDGWLDEVAVWSTDLDERAIRTIYRARGRADLRRSWADYRAGAHLVGYWRMGDGPESGAGILVHDLSAGHRHGALMPDPPESAPVFERSTLR